MRTGDHDIDKILEFANSGSLETAHHTEEKAGALVIAACALMVKARFSRTDARQACIFVVDKFYNTLDEIEREEMS